MHSIHFEWFFSCKQISEKFLPIGYHRNQFVSLFCTFFLLCFVSCVWFSCLIIKFQPNPKVFLQFEMIASKEETHQSGEESGGGPGEHPPDHVTATVQSTTPLHLAACEGSLETIKSLLKTGSVQVDTPNQVRKHPNNAKYKQSLFTRNGLYRVKY